MNDNMRRKVSQRHSACSSGLPSLLLLLLLLLQAVLLLLRLLLLSMAARLPLLLVLRPLFVFMH
jgi:hypothetical protein